MKRRGAREYPLSLSPAMKGVKSSEFREIKGLRVKSNFEHWFCTVLKAIERRNRLVGVESLKIEDLRVLSSRFILFLIFLFYYDEFSV
ncbi:hypothetical protein HanIR_Chr08g0375361 [Helianthus annuus]|nr:hypothetical protein HanIR_Chr08g0375361 [Helianthus annuus]